MKTKLFLAALTLVSLLFAVAPLEAQFVTWDRQAHGELLLHPCGSTYNWPNNNNWTQQLVTGVGCEQAYIAEPSNWSTPTYPNGPGVDVSLGNRGGAPTNLDRGAPITVRSLTVLNEGGLTAEYGSRLTANVLDFQGDGALLAAGGGGPAPTFTLTSGGLLKKSGGINVYTLDPSIFLQVLSGGTIASEAGTLQLPSGGTTYAGGVNFNAASGAVIDLAPAAGSVQISGQFTGSNVGGTVRLREGFLGTVPGSGGATFSFIGDTFQWRGGAIIGSSAADPFINAGTMNITGSAGVNGQGFINQGTLAQSGPGAFNIPFGSGLSNAAGGAIDLRNDNGLTGLGGGGGGPFINNFGMLRKSAGAGTSVIHQSITFNNIQGTIRVDTGTLVLAGGLTARGGTGDGGTFVVAPGATLQLTDGTNDAVYHGAYTGSGGGTVLMSGANLVPDVFNTGLTLNLPGSMFQWTGGVIGGYQSAVPVTNAGTMTLAGSGDKATYGNFFNSGTIIQKDTGRLGVSVPNSGGVFTNNAPAVYDLQSDAGLYSGTFNNSGLFKKSGGAGTSLVEGPFNNAGTVAANLGTIQFTQFQQTAGVTGLNGGNLAFGNQAIFDGGSLVGSGTITGSVKNNGAIMAPGFSPGKITISGNYTQGPNGVLTLEIGGTLPATQYDQLVVSGAAIVDGTLNLSLINGYQPAGGETFQLLLPGSLTGTFSTVNTIGFTGTVTYSSSGITITVTTPTPTPTPNPTPTATPSATATATPSATATATPSATATATPSATATATPSATATATPSATATATPSATATATPSATATATPSATATATPSATATATPSATATATPSATATATPSATATATPSATATATPSATATATPSATATATPSATATATPSATATATPSATATATPSATATATPSATATATPSATATATPSATATATPSATATATPSATATATPSATVTATPSATATATPSATATTTPSATATATPSATSTATPTATPSATPTPSPSPTPTATPSPTPGQLLNIATRLRVQTDDNVLIGGLIVTGTDQKRVLLRAIGPSLSPLFQGALANPTIELYQGNTLLASNDDWKESQQTEIEATTIPPTNELESAIVRTLSPGAYTAIMRGKDGGTGIGVVEAYDLDQAANSKLANISTRGFVDTGDNVMIGGMIAGGNGGGNTRVLIRALGPSLATFGINGALQDPTLELRDANGGLLRANDNWQGDQQGEIEATLIPPPNAAESAIVATLIPGNYTAILRGKGETTGVALVEVYNIQ